MAQSPRTAAAFAACLVTHRFRALPYAELPVDASAVNAVSGTGLRFASDQGPLERFSSIPPHFL
jgi:hypothetical protein